jgi:cell filamentation protein
VLDKYGVGQDSYCYPSTSVLINRLGLMDDDLLSQAEHDLTQIAASEIDFELPPYNLAYLQQIHRYLFRDVYDWAGEIRTVDISKADTRFCNVNRIDPEASKLFLALAKANWLEGFARSALVSAAAEFFGDLNVIHPFREGNGRAQRILFEHIIVNAGYEIDWWVVGEGEWIQANIDAVVCDYTALVGIFNRCIGRQITA